MNSNTSPIEIPSILRPVILGTTELCPDRTLVEINFCSIINVPQNEVNKDVIFIIAFMLVRKGFPLAGIPYVMNVSKEEIKLLPIPELNLLSIEPNETLWTELTKWVYNQCRKQHFSEIDRLKNKVETCLTEGVCYEKSLEQKFEEEKTEHLHKFIHNIRNPHIENPEQYIQEFKIDTQLNNIKEPLIK
jgi:hypothetical protein